MSELAEELQIAFYSFLPTSSPNNSIVLINPQHSSCDLTRALTVAKAKSEEQCSCSLHYFTQLNLILPPHSSTFHSGRFLSCKLETYRISLQTSQTLSGGWVCNDVALISSRLLLVQSYKSAWIIVCAAALTNMCVLVTPGQGASRSLMHSACRTEPRGPRHCHAGEEESDFPTNHFQLAELWLEPCDSLRQCTTGSQFVTYGNMINGIKCFY